MKEYIERSAAITALRDLPFQWDVEDLAVYEAIEEVPTADVAPVVHGKWIKEIRPKKSDDGLFYWNSHPRVVYVCSECGRAEKEKEPYCNCGAKMDKDTISSAFKKIQKSAEEVGSAFKTLSERIIIDGGNE